MKRFIVQHSLPDEHVVQVGITATAKAAAKAKARKVRP